MPPKKRPADAPSPVSGLSCGFGALQFCSQGSSQSGNVTSSQGSIVVGDNNLESQDSWKSQSQFQSESQSQSQQYSQPEYFSGDFCTPEDQTADLNWSQSHENAEPNSAASSTSKMCPPTPDVASKRRKTASPRRLRANKHHFTYDLDALQEDDEDEKEECKDTGTESAESSKFKQTKSDLPCSTGRKAPPVAPSKRGTKKPLPRPETKANLITSYMSQESVPAAARPSASPEVAGRGADCMQSLSPVGGVLFGPTCNKESTRRAGSAGAKVGAKACRQNPFLTCALTDKERRTPSRALPRLERGAKATRYLQDFEELSILGQGNFGNVFLARSRIDGQTYAIKRKDGFRGHGSELNKQEERAMREVWAMAALAHVPNVVRYHGAWCENSQLFIQMEACECHIKERYLGKNPSACVLLRILVQIGTALAGMHEMGLAHLDVKPDNIYCSADAFRLGDFGLVCSQTMVNDGIEPEEGDGRYASPQVIEGLSQLEVKELAPCDVYALGATVLELAYGRSLSTRDAQYAQVREGAPVELADTSPAGSLLASILTEMLHPGTDLRINCAHAVTLARTALARHGAGAAADGGAAQEDVDMTAGVEEDDPQEDVCKMRTQMLAQLEEIQRLREELSAERARVAHLEGFGVLNASVSSQRSDAEPQGSQELQSPVRSAQAMPIESPSPMHAGVTPVTLTRRSPRAPVSAKFAKAARSPASAAHPSPAPKGASPMFPPAPRPPRGGTSVPIFKGTS